jgi:hypothetical protein
MKKPSIMPLILISFAVIAATAFVISQKAPENIAKEQIADSGTLSTEINQQESNIVEFEEIPNSYTIGYDKGYKSFLEQNGRVDLSPVKKYTAYVEQELEKDEVDRGYVDGYHRAADTIYCPRGH